MLLLEERETQETEAGIEITHYICAELPDLAYCGKNVADAPWVPEPDEPVAGDCALCVLVWQGSTEHCPTCKTPWEGHA